MFFWEFELFLLAGLVIFQVNSGLEILGQPQIIFVDADDCLMLL
jgi:hypothetical protein